MTAPAAASPFEVDPFNRELPARGPDEIALTLRHEERIAAYEAAHPVSPVPA